MAGLLITDQEYMAKWKSQREVPSVSARSRRRTSYLEALRPDIVDIVTTYIEARPNAEDVTLEVLDRLGRDRLVAAATNGDLNRLRQDVGLLVAQCLVDVFGPERVLSLRAEDGIAVSTRRNTREGLDWVGRFTPHRVLAAASTPARILLDTVTVRKIVHGDTDALDLSELARKRGEHRISIADGGLAELAAALMQERLSIDVWSANVGRLDAVLDPDAPVFPGGLELATLAGLRDPPGYDMESSRAYYRAAWEFLRSAKTKRDLERPHDYIDAAGQRFRLRLDRTNVETVLAGASDKWTNWVESAGQQLQSLRGEGDDLDEESLRNLVRTFLMLDGMTAAALDKIDVAVRVIARRTMQAAARTHPYSPSGPNDALDFDLLFGIPLPAIVCTSDYRLIRLVVETGSADAAQVMSPADLVRFL